VGQVVSPARRMAEARELSLLVMLAAAVAVVVLAVTQGGPAFFLHLGPKTPGLEKVQEVLGPDVPLPSKNGHDGDRFWQLARDPLLLDDESLGTYLDRPEYRAQRIGYPALASPWGLLGEGALLWGMVVTNILAMGVGTYVTGRWVAERGGSARWGFAFAFNPLVWIGLLFDLGDVVALAGLVTALYGIDRRRHGVMVAGAVVAVLAKEPMLLGLVGAAALARGLAGRDRLLLVGPAVLSGLLWRGYILTRPGLGDDREVQEFVLVPFAGYVRSWRLAWWPQEDWLQAALSFALLAVSLAIIAAWARDRRAVLLCAAMPFAAMAPFLSAPVVSVWANLVRAVGPALLIASVHVGLSLRRDDPVPQSSEHSASS
jgi:hypothetical protein